ncbi:uncharacterized protein isoform X2 [Musca autumnalis]|uniref:uncharacterized protein isoform X2 n=1 Tax=Musca autumnalis TaxID=221902 RepID=UPI003CF7A155
MVYQQLLSRKLLFGALALLISLMLGNAFAADIDCSKRPPRIDPLTCCNVPDIITEDIKEKCKMAMPLPPPHGGFPYPPLGTMSSEEEDMSTSTETKQTRPTGPPNGRRPHPPPFGPPPHCFISCALNETGILMATPDAKLDETKLSEYLKKVLTNATDMIPILETSFKTCAVQVEDMRQKFKELMEQKKSSSSTPSSNESRTKDRMMRPSMMPPRPHCPPMASHLMGCVFRESFINCPASMWSNTEQCNEMRDHMKNCKPNKMMNGKTETSNLLDKM